MSEAHRWYVTTVSSSPSGFSFHIIEEDPATWAIREKLQLVFVRAVPLEKDEVAAPELPEGWKWGTMARIEIAVQAYGPDHSRVWVSEDGLVEARGAHPQAIRAALHRYEQLQSPD